MPEIVDFFKSEFGRRLTTWLLVTLGAAVTGGIIPLDYGIPILGITTGQLFTTLGIGVAATAGSSSRK